MSSILEEEISIIQQGEARGLTEKEGLLLYWLRMTRVGIKSIKPQKNPSKFTTSWKIQSCKVGVSI